MDSCIGYIADFSTVRAVFCPSNFGPFKLIEGPANFDFEEKVLPTCLEYARKIAPFAQFAFVPGWEHDGTRNRLGGACGDKAVIAIRLNKIDAISIVFHECWHLCEVLMSDYALDALDSTLSTGIMWQDTYLDNKRERRAHAFEHFAMMLAYGIKIEIS